MSENKNHQPRSYYPRVFMGYIYRDAPARYSASRVEKRLRCKPLTREESLEIPASVVSSLNLIGKEMDLVHLDDRVGRIIDRRTNSNTNDTEIAFKLYDDTPSSRRGILAVESAECVGLSLTTNELYVPDRVLKVEAVRVAICVAGARPGTWIHTAMNSDDYKAKYGEQIRASNIPAAGDTGSILVGDETLFLDIINGASQAEIDAQYAKCKTAAAQEMLAGAKTDTIVHSAAEPMAAVVAAAAPPAAAAAPAPAPATTTPAAAPAPPPSPAPAAQPQVPSASATVAAPLVPAGLPPLAASAVAAEAKEKETEKKIIPPAAEKEKESKRPASLAPTAPGSKYIDDLFEPEQRRKGLSDALRSHNENVKLLTQYQKSASHIPFDVWKANLNMAASGQGAPASSSAAAAAAGASPAPAAPTTSIPTAAPAAVAAPAASPAAPAAAPQPQVPGASGPSSVEWETARREWEAEKKALADKARESSNAVDAYKKKEASEREIWRHTIAEANEDVAKHPKLADALVSIQSKPNAQGVINDWVARIRKDTGTNRELLEKQAEFRKRNASVLGTPVSVAASRTSNTKRKAEPASMIDIMIANKNQQIAESFVNHEEYPDFSGTDREAAAYFTVNAAAASAPAVPEPAAAQESSKKLKTVDTKSEKKAVVAASRGANPATKNPRGAVSTVAATKTWEDVVTNPKLNNRDYVWVERTKASRAVFAKEQKIAAARHAEMGRPYEYADPICYPVHAKAATLLQAAKVVWDEGGQALFLPAAQIAHKIGDNQPLF